MIDGRLRELEQDRTATYASPVSQVQSMTRTSSHLNDHTRQLVSALRSPKIRGHWGAIQLERVVELDGMVRHCDFGPRSAPA